MSKAKPIKYTGARVYSYIRFSSLAQAKGDSERRQKEAFEAARATEATKAFAARNGLEFDESFRLKDEGLSGFTGTHRKRGKLGEFLKCVKGGDVPRGSVLVVEKVSRLSREGVYGSLKNIVFDLLENDITIQILSPELAFDRKSIESPQIHVLICLLQGAYQESKDKSDYGRASWKAKRKQAVEEKRCLTGRVPAWLNVVWDRSDSLRPKPQTLEPIPEAVETIRLIFDLKLKGAGLRTIEQKLNAEAPWKPHKGKNRKGEGWRASYIKKILKNPAVVGEYQPHERTTGKRIPVGEPIPSYFPRVIEPEVFLAVQAKFAANLGKGGRIGKAKNLLRHLAICAYCGGPMAFVDRGPPPKGGKYLVCDTGRRCVRDDQTGQPKCKRHAIRYEEVEKLVLENCKGLRPEQVLPDPNEQAERCRTHRQRVMALDAELRKIDEQAENLIDQIANTKDRGIRDRYEAKVRALDERKAATMSEKTTTERELRKAEHGQESFATWQRNLESLQKALRKGDVDLRTRLQVHLREFIDRIEVFAIGHRKIHDPEAKWRAVEDAAKRLGRRNRKELLRDPKVIESEDGDPIGLGIEELASELFPDKVRDKNFRANLNAFIDHVMERRRTREGRFLRLHFLGGGMVDLVPPGGLGSGMKLDRERGSGNGWYFVSPSIDKLWQDFKANQGSGKRKKEGGKVK